MKKTRKMDLSKIDAAKTPFCQDKEQAQVLLEKYKKRIYELFYLMFAENQRSVLIILQGIDTSGKDGVVRFLFDAANPQGLKMFSFKKPSDEDLKHDFLWRCHKVTPASGETVIFNRSYYEDVIATFVHPEFLLDRHLPDKIKASKDLFKMRYNQINDFERMLKQNGTSVLKFLLHITKAEQKERLKARVADPTKNWKFSVNDLKERKLWSKNMKAFEAMVDHTSTKDAPWVIVPANKKWYRDLIICKTIVEHLESLKMKYPKLESKPKIS